MLRNQLAEITAAHQLPVVQDVTNGEATHPDDDGEVPDAALFMDIVQYAKVGFYFIFKARFHT
jgi:hypothetical protein